MAISSRLPFTMSEDDMADDKGASFVPGDVHLVEWTGR